MHEEKGQERVPGEKALLAFMERCYGLYEQKMYQAAYRILGDCAQAEDAVQDAFLKLMKGRVYFQDALSEECKKYIITVIRHSAIDIYNKKKREGELISFSCGDLYWERAASQGNRGEEGQLEELLSGLGMKYYQVVDCLAIKNLSVKETSGKLGISEANVRKRFQRAKKMLKAAWAERMGKTYERKNRQ